MVNVVCLWCLWAGLGEKPFIIEVVDDRTGRGVPLVEVRTVNDVRSWTDSNGVAAFDEPGLMDREVFFFVESHGYEYPKDGFGFRGIRLTPTHGGSAKLKIRRINIAERLYRITGGGIFRDSVIAGKKVPTKEPVLNGQVFGSDTVQNAIFEGKLFWVWGDTNRPGYPLGNFQVTAATSILPANGGLDPEVGIDLSYFVGPSGFAKEICKMPGEGLTWIDGLVALKDKSGKERLLATYVKVKAPMNVYAKGLAEFNPDKQIFEHRADLDAKAPIRPNGHTFRHREGETEYVYFADPFALTRIRADAESFLDPSCYESFTCLEEGSTIAEPKLRRTGDGKLEYQWTKNAPSIGLEEQEKLVQQRKLTRDEGLWRLTDAATKKSFRPHRGSVQWNEFRKRWIMITVEVGGSSYLGEVWYAEATSPTGPWSNAVKVVTHNQYSFYNPKLHPYFDKEGGRYVFFEGTYTVSFSGNKHPTPRYEYNQILYKLDLADPRLRAASQN